MNYKKIKDYMEKRRDKKHWSKMDIERIEKAMNDGQWDVVKQSKLYIKYGGEYCELLEAIAHS